MDFVEAHRPPVFKISAKVSLKSQWKPFVSRFKDYLTDFEFQRLQVENEASLAHRIEAKHGREQQEQSQALARARRKEKALRNGLRRVSPVQYKNQLRRFQTIRHERTGGWFFKEETFDQWIHSARPSLLRCTGIPGSGKTILASTTVLHLEKLLTKPADLVAYFFFEHSEPGSLRLEAMLGALIQQMVESHLRPIELVEWVLERCNEDRLPPTSSDLIEIILKILPSYKRLVLVLDGLDELEAGDQNTMYRMLKQMLAVEDCLAKVIVFSRDVEVLSRSFTDEDRSLKLTTSNMGHDLNLYVEETIQIHVDDGRLVFRDPRLRQEIVDSLKTGAKDMYVRSLLTPNFQSD
jgi:hypothetical protein